MRRQPQVDVQAAVAEMRELVGIDDTYRFFLTSGGAEARAHIAHQQRPVASLAVADGLTGLIQPIEDHAHLDITHALGKLYLSDIKADYISFEIDGLGALFVSEKVPFEPLFKGGNPKRIAQLLECVRTLCAQFETINLETVRLRNLLEESVPGARLPFADTYRLPHIAVMAFDALESESLLFYLDAQGIIGERIDSDTVSFTLTVDITQEEIERAAGIIRAGVEMLQLASRGLV